MKNKSTALLTAKDLIQSRFPTVEAAFLAGSYVRGGATETSDLDIVVIVSDLPDLPFRESLVYQDWPVELFVHSLQSIYTFFYSDCKRRRPALPQMCAEALILMESQGIANTIKQDAKALLKKGPERLSDSEMLQLRYQVTDLLDDFRGVQHEQESWFIAALLIEKTVHFLLAAQQQWIGQGKWAWRALFLVQPEEAFRLENAMQNYYRLGQKKDLIDWTIYVLDPYGGPLFDGYYSSASGSSSKGQPNYPLEST